MHSFLYFGKLVNKKWEDKIGKQLQYAIGANSKLNNYRYFSNLLQLY